MLTVTAHDGDVMMRCVSPTTATAVVGTVARRPARRRRPRGCGRLNSANGRPKVSSVRLDAPFGGCQSGIGQMVLGFDEYLEAKTRYRCKLASAQQSGSHERWLSPAAQVPGVPLRRVGPRQRALGGRLC